MNQEHRYSLVIGKDMETEEHHISFVPKWQWQPHGLSPECPISLSPGSTVSLTVTSSPSSLSSAYA